MDNTVCERVSELLPLYFGGALGVRGRAEVAAHLAVCANCRKEAAFALTVSKACKTAFPDPDAAFTRDAFKLLDSGAEPERAKTPLETLAEAYETVRGALRLTRKVINLTQII